MIALDVTPQSDLILELEVAQLTFDLDPANSPMLVQLLLIFGPEIAFAAGHQGFGVIPANVTSEVILEDGAEIAVVTRPGLVLGFDVIRGLFVRPQKYVAPQAFKHLEN